MNRKKNIILAAFILVFLFVFNAWESAGASDKSSRITKSLSYQKPLDISLGKAGVYFPSSAYTGSAVLTRIKPTHTKQLTFSQRWVDIHLYDSTGKEFKNVYGFVYLYFNLDKKDRAAWDKGELSIYYYNEVKRTWEACETRLITDKNSPYGRVSFLMTQNFGLYGLAITR